MHAAKTQDAEPTTSMPATQLAVGQEAFLTHSILYRGKIVEIREYTVIIAFCNGDTKTKSISRQFALTDKRAAISECEDEARYWQNHADALRAEIKAEEEQQENETIE